MCMCAHVYVYLSECIAKCMHEGVCVSAQVGVCIHVDVYLCACIFVSDISLVSSIYSG